MTKPFNPSSISHLIDEMWYRKAKKDRRASIHWLEKQSTRDAKCATLAEKISRCKSGRRCGSLACPECSAAFQRAMSCLASRFLNGVSEVEILCVTIIPADGLVALGSLTAADHYRYIRRWKHRLAEAGIELFIGAVDWSVNEEAQGGAKPRWCVHLHGIALYSGSPPLQKLLKKQFPAGSLILRPVKIDHWDRRKDWLRYCFKPDFHRRIVSTRSGRRKVDKQPLRSKQRRELLLHLDEIGMNGRLLLRYAQVIALRGSGVAIVRRPGSR
jgi:hypothetical protein